MKWSSILQHSVTHAAAAVIATITIAAFLHHMIIAAKQSTIDVQRAQIGTLKEENKRLRAQLGEAGPFELLTFVERRKPVRLDEGGWSERVVFDVATTDNINGQKPASGTVNKLSSEPILSEPIEFEVRDVTDRFIVMCTFGKEISVNWIRVAEGRWLNADENFAPGTFPCRVRSRTHIEITDASGGSLQRKQLDDGFVFVTRGSSLAQHSYAYIASGMIQVSGLRLGHYLLQILDSNDLVCNDENWGEEGLRAARHDLRIFLWRF